MFAKLYPVRPPDKRCLLLAKAMADVSTLTGSECIFMAQEIYQVCFSQNAPAVLPVKNGSDTTALEQICAESGIVIEFTQAL